MLKFIYYIVEATLLAFRDFQFPTLRRKATLLELTSPTPSCHPSKKCDNNHLLKCNFLIMPWSRVCHLDHKKRGPLKSTQTNLDSRRLLEETDSTRNLNETTPTDFRAGRDFLHQGKILLLLAEHTDYLVRATDDRPASFILGNWKCKQNMVPV